MYTHKLLAPLSMVAIAVVISACGDTTDPKNNQRSLLPGGPDTPLPCDLVSDPACRPEPGCEALDEMACVADPNCEPIFSDEPCACPACIPGEMCPPCDCPANGFVGCQDVGPCENLDEMACVADPSCQPIYDDEPCACHDCRPGEPCEPCGCPVDPDAYAGCEPTPPPGPCEGLDEMSCIADPSCEPAYNDIGCACPDCPPGEDCDLACDCPVPGDGYAGCYPSEPRNHCDGLDERGCNATPGCLGIYGPTEPVICNPVWCPPDVPDCDVCPEEEEEYLYCVVDRPVDPCAHLDEWTCIEDPICEPEYLDCPLICDDAGDCWMDCGPVPPPEPECREFCDDAGNCWIECPPVPPPGEPECREICDDTGACWTECHPVPPSDDPDCTETCDADGNCWIECPSTMPPGGPDCTSTCDADGNCWTECPPAPPPGSECVEICDDAGNCWIECPPHCGADGRCPEPPPPHRPNYAGCHLRADPPPPPPMACTEPACDIYCEFGYVTGPDGCALCACAEDPNG